MPLCLALRKIARTPVADPSSTTLDCDDVAVALLSPIVVVVAVSLRVAAKSGTQVCCTHSSVTWRASCAGRGPRDFPSPELAAPETHSIKVAKSMLEGQIMLALVVEKSSSRMRSSCGVGGSGGEAGVLQRWGLIIVGRKGAG